MAECNQPGCRNSGKYLEDGRKYCHCHRRKNRAGPSGIGRQNRNGDTTTRCFNRGGGSRKNKIKN